MNFLGKLYVDIPDQVHRNLKKIALDKETTLKELVNEILESAVQSCMG